MKSGDLVTCIDDIIFHANTMDVYKQWPAKGKDYVVREVRPAAAEGGILLEEIKNAPIYFPFMQGYLEPAFNPNRFVKKDEQLVETLQSRHSDFLERTKPVKYN